jgi:chemotaxis protein MotB
MKTGTDNGDDMKTDDMKKNQTAKITNADSQAAYSKNPYIGAMERSKSSTEDNIWLITMTDMMSLLLVFFVMFFAITKKKAQVEIEKLRQMRINVEETKAPAKMPETKMPETNVTPDKIYEEPAPSLGTNVSVEGAKIKDELDAAFKGMDVTNDVRVRAKSEEVVITINNGIMFNSSDAKIVGRVFYPILNKIAGIIVMYPSFKVEIDGHTDNVPIDTPKYHSNWELSAARAMSVLRYFIDDEKLDATRFYVKGNGGEHPVAPNDTDENRALNRRVEIRLKKSS